MNLFKGFNAKKLDSYDPAVIEPILNHIKEVFNSGIEEHAEYTLKWFASMVQQPWKKNETALVLYGKQGTGKNIFLDWIGDMVIGRNHYIYIKNLNDLTGQFTSLYSGKIFTVCDEVSFAGGYKTNNILKSLITQKWQKLEKKRADPTMIDDYNNFIFLSNNDDAVKIEDSDRRYFVKKLSNKHRRKKEYFVPLGEALTQETADHFYTYLLSVDLKGWSPRDIPETEEKKEMRLYSKTPIELFADELLDGNIPANIEYDDEGRIEGKTYFDKNETYEVTLDTLFQRYQEWFRAGNAGNVRNELSKPIFSRKLRGMVNLKDATPGNRLGGVKCLLKVEPVDS